MELKQIMRDAGIVGAGGAGFPSYAKLADGADTVLINAAECEPLLFTDIQILHEDLTAVCDGARLAADALGAKRVLLGIKKHKAEHLGVTDGEVLAYGVTVKALPDIYPLGDEINLIYEATGRLVQPGCLPISQGVVVFNVETSYNISKAVRENRPVTEKWLTVSGDIHVRPVVLKVPVGTPFKKILDDLGVNVPATHVVIEGGPAMGSIVNYASASVTKKTKGIVILPRDIPAVTMKLRTPENHRAIAASACCQCTVCTDMCPRALLGYPVEPHRLVRATPAAVREFPEAYASASLCCGCAVCAISACNQAIAPNVVATEIKKILSENKIRFKADAPVTPDPDREARRLPAARWRSMLGVAKFHHHPNVFRVFETDTVRVPMRMHIGAPAIPAVKVGDKVERGALIATAAEGLSLPHHAPITGTVTYVDANVIEIRA